MSTEQKNMRLRINECKDIGHVKILRTQDNKLKLRIKEKNLEIKENDIIAKIDVINESKDTAKTFNAIRELSRKTAENPYVHDAKGRSITQPNAIYAAVRTTLRTTSTMKTNHPSSNSSHFPHHSLYPLQLERLRKVRKS